MFVFQLFDNGVGYYARVDDLIDILVAYIEELFRAEGNIVYIAVAGKDGDSVKEFRQFRVPRRRVIRIRVVTV